MQQQEICEFVSIFEEKEKCDRLWESVEDSRSWESQYLMHGQLQMKVNKRWELVFLELYQEELLKIQIGEKSGEVEEIRLQACVLKKLKQMDHSRNKFGLRLERGVNKVELFCSSLEEYEKWYEICLSYMIMYEELQRLTILPKFTKRHKLLQRVKINHESYPFPCVYYRCYKFFNSAQYQVRVVDKKQLSPQQKALLLQEIRILRHFHHPNIQKLLEIYEDEANLYMLFDNYLGKDISLRLYDYSTLPEKFLADFFYKLISALFAIHHKSILHKMLTPENIILRTEHNMQDICIANFFAAEKLNQSSPVQHSINPEYIDYIAPELKLGHPYDAKVDVYSVGILLNNIVHRNLIKSSNRLNHNPNNTNFSASGLDLIKQMTHQNPQLRITSAQALKHSWFINKHTKEQAGGEQSLVTIIEKSENDISVMERQLSMINFYYHHISANRLVVRQSLSYSQAHRKISASKSTESINFHFEMEHGDLFQKLFHLNQIQCQSIPSKQRHHKKLSKQI